MQGCGLSVRRRKYRALRKGVNSAADTSDTVRFNRNSFVVKFIRSVAIAWVISVIFSANSFCRAENINAYDEIYSVSGADEFDDALDSDVKDFLDEFNISIDNPSSLADFNGYDLIIKLIEKSLNDMNSPIFLLSSVCIMSVIYAVIFNATPEKEGSLTTYFLPCASTVLAAMSLVEVISYSARAVSSCSVFMLSFIPVYAGVLISGGKPATGGAYSALMFTVSQTFCAVADRLIVPLCGSMMIASIGSAFNELCGRIGEMLKKAAVTVITLCMTVFTFVLGLQTAISSVSDSVAIKTTKAAIGSFVPIVGSSLSESLSVILGSVSLFKSTVGVYAMICLAVMIVPSLVSVLAYKAVLSILCAVTQSIGAGSTAKLLGMMNGVLTVLMCVLLCSAVVYIVSVAITLSVGG